MFTLNPGYVWKLKTYNAKKKEKEGKRKITKWPHLLYSVRITVLLQVFHPKCKLR